MERISKAIDVLLGPVDQQQQMILGARLSSALVTNRQSNEEKESKYAHIVIIIAEVERVKQIHLADEERDALALELMKLGESLESIRKRGEAVKRNTTFQKISFEYWIGCEQLYTASEVNRLVLQRIEQRRRQLERINIPIEQLEEAGLVEFATVYARKYALAMEPIIAKLKTRCRRIQAFIRQAPEDVKLEIKAIAEKEGVMKDDPYWRMSLPFAAPYLLDEVEKLIKQMPTTLQRNE